MDKKLISEWEQKVLKAAANNPRSAKCVPITETLDNVSDKVRVIYELQREKLIKQFIRPETLAFQTFCRFIETKDDIAVLKDLIRLIYYSRKQLEAGETTCIIKTFIKMDCAEELIEMFLKRSEYCLLPNIDSLTLLMTHFKNKCLISFDMGDSEAFSKNFTNLLQVWRELRVVDRCAYIIYFR